jgi:carotenoid cleavage dioxygenase-like enzyme
MFIFGWLQGGYPAVSYRFVSKDGVLGDAVPITTSGPIMMHDFAITQKYAIFMECPIYFSPMVWIVSFKNSLPMKDLPYKSAN